MLRKVLLALCGITFISWATGFTERLVAFFMLPSAHSMQSAVPIGGPFEFQDANGHVVKDTDFRGQYMLVYFGYAFCPDICPTALENITSALNQLPTSITDQLTPIFITVDPERDHAEFLKKYKTAYHPKFIMLLGTQEQTEIAKRNYRVYAQKVPTVEGQKEYLIDHSSIIYLMDKRGEFITHFSHGTPPQDLIQKIQEVVK